MPIDREEIRRRHRHADVRLGRHPFVILADNLDKESNLGAILRSAEAFRCERVVTDRPQPDTAGAMGSQHWQPVEWNADLVSAAQACKSNGFAIVALEQMVSAQPINTFRFPVRCGLVIGSEAYGVSAELLEMADSTVYIPQAGLVKSLNVSAAAAVAMYEYSRQHWMPGFEQPERLLAPSIDSLRVPTRGSPGRVTDG